MNKSRYTFGFADYRTINGEKPQEWPLVRNYTQKYDRQMAICYVGLAISMSMVVAPMAWVKLFKWMLT